MGTIAQRLQVDVNLLFITGLLVGLLALRRLAMGCCASGCAGAVRGESARLAHALPFCG
ncbi:MAG: hypothetical protein R2867_16100 [Caldilineaceae bacterium]